MLWASFILIHCPPKNIEEFEYHSDKKKLDFNLIDISESRSMRNKSQTNNINLPN